MIAPRLSTTLIAFGFALAGALLASLLNSGTATFAQDEKAAAPLRHVVCFKFKDDATKEQIQEIVAGFAALPKKIDGVTSNDLRPRDHMFSRRSTLKASRRVAGASMERPSRRRWLFHRPPDDGVLIFSVHPGGVPASRLRHDAGTPPGCT